MIAPVPQILWVLLTGPAQLGIEPPEQGIYGGLPVPDGQLQSVVAISIGTGLCTGTLVRNDLVITAAHCFASEIPASAIEVIVGNDRDDPDAVLAVEAYDVHPCAKRGCAQDGFDFAWIKLAEPVSDPADGYPQPIFWQPEYDELAAVGSTVRVVGFGKDLAGDDGIKRAVDVPINSFLSYGYEFEAGGAGRDSCDGDSGGPALALSPDGQWRIVGLLSRGFTCGQGGIYVVPLPSLCWAEESSGVQLVPDWCGGCGCLDLDPERNGDGGGCRIVSVGESRASWGLLWLLGLVGVFVGRIRRYVGARSA